MDIRSYEKYVYCLEQTSKNLREAAQSGDEEVKELSERVDKIYLKERYHCLCLLREMGLYPRFLN